MKTINAILDFLFGRKYYICVLGCPGEERYYLSLDYTKADAEDRMRRVRAGRTFVPQYIMTVRSHKDLIWHKETLNNNELRQG